jgi:hypothetical protein
VGVENATSLVWLGAKSHRWSQLCPSLVIVEESYQQTRYVCSNDDCDLTGQCVIKFEEAENKNSNEVIVNLIDNVNDTTTTDDAPKFPDSLKFVNLTIELNDVATSDSAVEYTLIESTAQLDKYHSKLVRSRNRFHFELCESVGDSSSFDPFTIRYEPAEEERLVLRVKPAYHELLKAANHRTTSFATFLYKLYVKRGGGGVVSSLSQDDVARVQINVRDNRLDRPVFDRAVYNFTIVENAPLNTVVGRVTALYLNAVDPGLIKYRIVPFVDDSEERSSLFNFMQELGGNGGGEEASVAHLPVRIEPATGLIVQTLIVDRERYVGEKDSATSSLGLISFNVEASYASSLYDYCKINIFIRDVNDNAPLARIKPLNNFDRSIVSFSFFFFNFNYLQAERGLSSLVFNYEAKKKVKFVNKCGIFSRLSKSLTVPFFFNI